MGTIALKLVNIVFICVLRNTKDLLSENRWIRWVIHSAFLSWISHIINILYDIFYFFPQ